MQLQGRDLKFEMQGKDVKLLHEELKQLGFALPKSELARNFFGAKTKEAVITFQKQHSLEPSGIVDERTAELINRIIGEEQPFTVNGRVIYADEMPMAGCKVRAFHQGFRTKALLLGETVADRTGHYEIKYMTEIPGHVGRNPVNLFVRAYDTLDNVIATSEETIIFNAPAEVTQDLKIDPAKFRQPSEHTQLISDITPILKNTPLIDLTAEDISLIAGESGHHKEKILLSVQAARLASEARMEPDIFYALGSQGISIASLSDVINQDLRVLRHSLEVALAGNIISDKPVDQIMDRLRELAIDDRINGDFGRLLRTSPVLIGNEAKQRAFINFSLLYEGDPIAFWDIIRKQPEFKDDEAIVKELQVTLDLGSLVQNYIPMAQLLQQELRQENDLPNLRNLAKLQINDWRGFIQRTGVPPNILGKTSDEKILNYTNTIIGAIEEKFPTAVIVNRLRKERELLPDTEALLEIFDQNNEFELATADIDRDLGETFNVAIREGAKSWQRVFRLSPENGRYQALKGLKVAGLDSAQHIIRLGPSGFFGQYADKLGKEQTQVVWDKASQINGLVLTLFSNFGAEFNKAMPKAVSNKTIHDLPNELEGKATLQELFGSLDFCDCEHCMSVYSAAAYLVDLMQFLKAGLDKNGRSYLAVLLGRRPDLAEIELSCENTDIRIPYVDLVNEVLENATARFALINFRASNLEDLALNNALQPYFSNLRDRFREAGQPLTEGAKLTSLEKRQRWMVDDADKSYIILNERRDQLYVYPLLKNQTRGKEEELLVQPAHINPSAYLKLAELSYPWNLPFDLWWEEARIYMAHLGFDRYAWMEKLPPVQAQISSEVRIACDHLGITTKEYELITAPLNTAEEPMLWGINGTIEMLCDIKLLLRQAGFDSKVPGENFKALRQLVHAFFIDPENLLAIRFDGDPCDLEKATLIHRGAGQPDWNMIFNRMRRFLRLQRKLNWSIPELDKAIRALATDLNGTFIQRISNLERLRTKFDIPLLEILSWWGTIDTAEDRSEKDEMKKIPSLYEQVFLNKSVENPANLLFMLNKQRNELKIAEQQQSTAISEIAEASASALGISVADLKRLLKNQDPKEDGTVENKLKLSNLSALYRMVSFSKALKLKIDEFLAAIDIIGIDPFADTLDAQQNVLQDRTTNALEFAKQISEIQASAFKISELDYLLRHRYKETTDLFVPTDAEIARVLAEIHIGLAKIADEAVTLPDPEGELTGKRLALLFGSPIIDQILKLLRWKTVVIDLPQGVALSPLPEALKEKVDYEAASNQSAGKLRVNGPLTQAEKLALVDLSQNSDYKTAINKLYDEPRTFLKQELVEKLKGFSWLIDALSQALDQKSKQQERFDYVLQAVNDYLLQTLSENLVKERLAGALSLNADATTLMLEKLVKAQLDNTKPALDDFLALAAPKLSEKIIQGNTQARQAIGMVQAERSGTYIFRTQPTINVKLWVNNRAIGQNGGIDLEAGKFYRLRLEYQVGQKPMLYWQPPSVLEQPVPAGRLIPAHVIVSYRLLHKCALFLTKLKIRADELSYMAANSNDFKKFDLNNFPLISQKGAPLYIQWRHLNTVFAFRDNYSQANVRLIDIFAVAQQSIDAAKERLLALTDWNKLDFDALAGQQVFNLNIEDLKGGNKLNKLHEAFVLLKRIGISAEQLIDWINTDLGAPASSLQNQKFREKEAVVQSLKQAVKTKYDHEQWLRIVKPLRDKLREKQRSALALFLVYNLGLKDTSELYGRFLIDVETSSCMLTSRIVQATGAIQLFIQRSLMGLEPEVFLSPEAAKEWEWRKNYRVWEANRKVFLYPENWIEPELRDDKSPFFKDMENEMLQSEVTNETVEKAFRTYLEKLDKVARLEIVGLFDQEDTDTKILHVFGRTCTTPQVYYYRRWINEHYWTPWEHIDLDIDSDHLIPVVWQRRLYIFWPIFTQKTKNTETPIKEEQGGNPPAKFWEIKLACSEYQNGKWAAKTMSSKPITTGIINIPVVKEKSRFHFKAELGEELSIICFDANAPTYYSHYVAIPGRFDFQECRSIPRSVPYGPGIAREILFPNNVRIENMMFIGDDPNDRRLYLPNAIPCALEKTPIPFRIIFPHHYNYLPLGPLFYQDRKRTFFVTVVHSFSGGGGPGSSVSPKTRRYLFSTFFHPYVCDFIKYLNRYGIKGLLGPEPNTDAFNARRQFIYLPSKDYFTDPDIKPNAVTIDKPYPVKDVEFSPKSAYSQYNWELFFHAPMLIANRLSTNQQFEEAMKWYHYIFNPLETADGYPPERYWKARPFYEIEKNGIPKRIQELMVLLSKGDSDMQQQVAEWIKNPFKPHAIARLRLPAYMKTVVMKYIDNLIAWGDQLFSQYTRESINEATQLYILSAEILGQRPEQVPARKHLNLTYRMMEEKEIGIFSNILIKIENKLVASGLSSVSWMKSQEEIPILDTLFFCIPNNDKLLKYWDTVEDRLFKIRHCMTIEGRISELPLFQPPIEPGILVRAAAAGIDIASVLSDLNAPLPHYRFHIMAQKATELCTEVRSLGAALLSAIEKKDAEELALMRSRHETQLLKAMRDVNEKQIEEARQTHEGLIKAKELARKRQQHYADLIKRGLNANEKQHTTFLAIAQMIQTLGQSLEMMASSAYSAPDTIEGVAGVAGSPVVLTKIGGSNVASSLHSASQGISMIASSMSLMGTMASITGGFNRRQEEWILQKEMADKELEQIDKQILAAETRVVIAEKNLQNHELQIETASEVDAYMHSKFTNKELYSWMVSQLSAIYFQSYHLAYDLAKRAERNYRYELGLADSDFIKFGYWDSLKKGLLAGERLHLDLKRMEVAYLEQNRRDYEIIKHISLAMLDSIALIQLKETGECFVNLPEIFFDLDYPGHYSRRIKSVAITIPCITGPYTNIPCTLTLISSRVRHDSKLLNGKDYAQNNDSDPRFTYSIGAIQSIVTSTGQNDSGLFETNLHDERYLPFEGAGVISQWHIELPLSFRPFDYNTISDVVLHLRYTAREAGMALRQQAMIEIPKMLNAIIKTGGLACMFSARHEFSNEWQSFLHPPDTATGDQKLTLKLGKDRFPYIFQDSNINIDKIELFIKVKKEFTGTHNESTLKLSLVAGKEASPKDVLKITPWSGLLKTEKTPSPAGSTGDRTLIASLQPFANVKKRLDANAIEDILIMCYFKI